MRQSVSESDGKLSFARVAGAVMVSSVVVGWWLDGFSLFGFELPDITAQVLGAGLLPYVGNKLANGLVDLMRK